MALEGLPDYGFKIPKMFLTEGDERTFQHQDTLPPLPVPPLQQTLDKYLDSVKPFLTPEEFRNTEFLVNQFGSGVGKDLHFKLCEKAKYNRNWLEKWWEDMAYLSNREPHAPHVNFAGPGPYLTTFWKPEAGTQMYRGSMVLWFTLLYWAMVRKEKLRVDRGGLKVKNVWCMHQFYRMFNGCKTPGLEMDKLNDYFRTEREGPCPDHVVVFCRGYMFKFKAVDDKGVLISYPEIRAHLEDIKSICDSRPMGPGIGCLTGDRRPDWFKMREHLVELSPQNLSNLEDIQTCICCFAFDDAEPTTLAEVSYTSLTGDPYNRFFDKNMTFIAYKNGAIGCNCDHTPADAMIMVAICFYHFLTIPQAFKLPDGLGPTTVRDLPKPQELVFKIDDVIQRGIAHAKQTFDKSAASLELDTFQYYGYGRPELRKHKVVPDTHMQLSIQLAYYRMYGRMAPTYETASTRRFYHGRTETVRSATSEAFEFAKAMLDSTVSQERRYQLYKRAADKHNKLMAEGQENQGCDRHLFGLYAMALEEGIETPALFTDPAYTKSGGGGNYILSTSFVGYTPVFGGVAPMCKNGYGTFYSIQDKSMLVYICRWTADEETDVHKFYQNIKQSLDETIEVLRTNPPKL